MLPLKLNFEDVQQIGVYQSINSSGLLKLICMFLLGRAEEIEDEGLRDSEAVTLQNSDLRFNNHRSEIYPALGEDESQSYFEFSSRFDYDIRRVYS